MLQPYAPPLATEVETGPDLMAPGSPIDVARFQYELWFRKEEFAAFRAFVRTDLKRGRLRFTIPVVAPTEEVTKTCWIEKGVYQARGLGAGAAVSFVLCVLDW